MTTPRQRPRTCVGCREESPKRALLRVVRSPSGDVFIDERGKLPGRGAYVCAALECVEKARKSKGLSRALKTEVKPEIYDRLGNLVYTGIDSVKLHSGRKEEKE